MWTTYFLSAVKTGVTSLVEISTSTSLSLTSESCACTLVAIFLVFRFGDDHDLTTDCSRNHGGEVWCYS